VGVALGDLNFIAAARSGYRNRSVVARGWTIEAAIWRSAVRGFIIIALGESIVSPGAEHCRSEGLARRNRQRIRVGLGRALAMW